MNTPAHLLVNLAVLGRRVPPRTRRWIAAGALLPDLPMFGFFVWQRLVVGASQRHTWGTAYFEAPWQTCFDLFHSVPIFAGLGLAALALGHFGPAWGCASVLLHSVVDAFLHREDGHRHLWPLSDWRFLSPVSYWDPANHGALGAGLEALAVVASTVVLWSVAGRASRVGLVALCVVSLGGWITFYAAG